MIKETSLFGVYIAPFAIYLGLAGLAYLPLRLAFDRLNIQHYVWHRSLFDLAVFVILLGIVESLI